MTMDHEQRVTELMIADAMKIAHAEGRKAGIEEAAGLHEPSCSCPHPCDDYWIWPSPCHKKAAAVIRDLKSKAPTP